MKRIYRLAIWGIWGINTHITMAYSAEWEPIIQTPNVVIAVDIDSYAQVGTFAKMETRYTYPTPQGYEKTPFLTKLKEAQFDCKKQRIWVTKTRLSEKKNPTNYSVTKPAEPAFRPFNDMDHEAEIASLVCQVQKMVGNQ